MNKIKQLLIGAALVAMPFSGFALTAHAQPADLLGNLDTVGGDSGLGDAGGDPIAVIGRLIQLFLGFLGVIFLILVLYAGFIWMTAAGDEKKVASAKNILMSAVVGLVVILAAYAISSFVITQLSGALQ